MIITDEKLNKQKKTIHVSAYSLRSILQIL